MADTQGSKPPAERQFHKKSLIVGFTIILGFGIFQAIQHPETPNTPEPVQTTQQVTQDVLKGSYPVPPAGAKTSTGESVEEAQKTYLSYANQQLVAGETDESLLSTGYALCGFYQESKTRAEVFAKIDEASKDDAGKLNRFSTLSSYVPRTLCPEFSTFR